MGMLPNNHAKGKSRKPAALLKKTINSSKLARVAPNTSKSSLTNRIRGTLSVAAVDKGHSTIPSSLQTVAQVPTPLAPRTVSSTSLLTTEDTNKPHRYVWYLGGNPIVKLLTSVDGDFDADQLATIAEVPSCIGDLALSVECLVSEDESTQGDFETELLAQITQNTLSCLQQKQQNITAAPPATAAITNPPSTATAAANGNATTTATLPFLPTTAEQAPTPAITNTSMVPTPLQAYDPVPNPLARITPPGSPTPISEATNDSLVASW